MKQMRKRILSGLLIFALMLNAAGIEIKRLRLLPWLQMAVAEKRR